VKLFTIEQTKAAYCADFAFYGATIVVLVAALLVYVTPARLPRLAFLAVLGSLGWSAAEYLVHRFIFHGVQPFQRWHAEHHARPAAFICAPTILTASLLGAFLLLLAWLIGNAWSACAVMLGVLSGYVAYGATHHAIHHWRAKNTWLRCLQRSHFIHHHALRPCYFGVTSGIWDRVCRSGSPMRGIKRQRAQAANDRTLS
jgi:Fatty acid hydroxylase superfamily